MDEERLGAIEVFCSYDHKDEPLWRELEKQLHFLKRRGSLWHHYAIEPGQEWRQKIEAHLLTAHIILLLISPDFLASDQCNAFEMSLAMKRHEAGEACVIPIILRPVYWQDEPFSKLQVLPSGGKPVKSWTNIDEAFYDIATNVQL